MPSDAPRNVRPVLAASAAAFICLATIASPRATAPARAAATGNTAETGSAAATATSAALDSRTAASGLKEALGVGTSRSVALLGRPDGYLKNLDVRIPMPDKLRVVDRSLRTIGRGNMVDEFVTSMNRAAEAAAPLAKDVFLDTIKQMSFEDAIKIVRGKNHEATDYLRANSGPRLDALFRPIVHGQLDRVGTTRSFDAMMRRASALPFGGKVAFDLEAYVTGKALDGLFLMIGREEEKIRRDPVARTTTLLRSVFGVPVSAPRPPATRGRRRGSGRRCPRRCGRTARQ